MSLERCSVLVDFQGSSEEFTFETRQRSTFGLCPCRLYATVQTVALTEEGPAERTAHDQQDQFGDDRFRELQDEESDEN